MQARKKRMKPRVFELSRDPFRVQISKRGMGWFIEPGRGNILFGSAILYADKGLAFSLGCNSEGHVLRLRYVDCTSDIGRIDDVVDAAKWVEEVNTFLATKRAVLQPDTPIYVRRGDVAG